MSHWHADANAPIATAGTRLTVLSDHQVVRLVTADSLSIELPSGMRVEALVSDRTGERLSIVLDDGRPLDLSMSIDESLLPPGQQRTTFSRQVWTTL
jgi:hypothetical protein